MDGSIVIRRRPWVFVFAALVAASAALLLHYRLRLGFVFDDWSFIIGRETGGVGDYLNPHNEHISVIPVAMFKLSLAVFGMGTAVPLQIFSLSVFLVSVVALFLYLRPLIGDPLSVAGCAVILFFGISYDDLLWIFQTGFSLSIAGGIGALLMLRREDRTGDMWACLFLTIAVMSSSMGIPLMIGVTVDLITRRRRLVRRAFVVAVPACIYLLWWLGWGHTASSDVSWGNVVASPRYVYNAFRTALSGLTGTFEYSGTWLTHLVAGAVLTSTAAYLFVKRKVPRSFLVAGAIGLSYWGLAALNAAPVLREYDAPRYQYPAGVFLLMILAGAFEGIRPRTKIVLPVTAVALLAIVVNISALNRGYEEVFDTYTVYSTAGLTAVEIARDSVPGDLDVPLGSFASVKAGDYLEAVDRYGSAAWSEDEIEESTEAGRARVDEQLIGSLPVSATPVNRIAATDCETITASEVVPEPTVTLDGSEIYLRPQRDVTVTLGRFLEGAQIRAIEAPGGETTLMNVPADRSDVPWRAGFLGTGAVKVCQ